ncbi:hypothetical protein HDU76_007266, partial [Blyttiomyces sp. JEL0837]
KSLLKEIHALSTRINKFIDGGDTIDEIPVKRLRQLSLRRPTFTDMDTNIFELEATESGNSGTHVPTSQVETSAADSTKQPKLENLGSDATLEPAPARPASAISGSSHVHFDTPEPEPEVEAEPSSQTDPWLKEDVPDPEAEDDMRRSGIESGMKRGSVMNFGKTIRRALTTSLGMGTLNSSGAQEATAPAGTSLSVGGASSLRARTPSNNLSVPDSEPHSQSLPNTSVLDNASEHANDRPILTAIMERIPSRPSLRGINREDSGSDLLPSGQLQRESTEVGSDGEEEEVTHERLNRSATLPTHPAFVAPAFRSVPRWVPIKGWKLALGLMILTILVCIGNIVANVIPSSDSNLGDSTNSTVAANTSMTTSAFGGFTDILRKSRAVNRWGYK